MNKDILNLIFSAFLFILFIFTTIEALTFTRLAQFFPLYISIAGAFLTLIYLVTKIIAYRKQQTEGRSTQTVPVLKPLRYIGWILGYLVLIYIGGLLLATAVFLFIFLFFESKMTLIKTSVSVVAVLVGISFLSSALDIYWPTNLFGL